MHKKGKITLYIIIGLVLVLSMSTFIYWNNLSVQQNLNQDTGTSISFSGLRTSAKLYVDDCLEQTTLKAIDEYGLLYSEKDIANYVDKNLLRCLGYFNDIIDNGYEVTYERPTSTVVINENQLFVDLFFPIVITGGKEEINIEDFQYKFRTTVFVNTPNGMLDEGTTLFSEDEDFVLKSVEDTKVVDNSGNEVTSFAVKTIDKEFEGLHNGVVIGEVVYDGTPDGATFSPAVHVEIRVDKLDLPVGYGASDPKVGYYDRLSGIWKTYDSCGFREDDKYYYYCGQVTHFTPMAVVACGEGEDGDFYFRMNEMYLSPIQPESGDEGFEELTWVENEGESEGKHLEDLDNMKNAKCLFVEESKESGIVISSSHHYGSDQRTGIGSSVFLRKYNQENEDGFPENTESESGVVENNGAKQCMFMVRDWDEDDAESGKINYGVVDTGCYNACVEDVKEKVMDMFSDVSSTQFGMIIKTLAEEEGKEAKELFAEYMIKKDGIVNPTEGKTTLECTGAAPSYSCKNVEGIMATIPTYGYDVIEKDWLDKDNLPEDFEFGSDEVEYVGGYGEYRFELEGDGNACENAAIQLLNPAYAKADDSECEVLNEEAGLNENQCGATPIDGCDISTSNCAIESGDGLSCSSGDKCVWTLNNEGHKETKVVLGDNSKAFGGTVREGVNVVGVWVENSNSDDNVDAYSHAILHFSGTGVKGNLEDCGTNIQDRMEYLNNCGRGMGAYEDSEDQKKAASNYFNCLGVARDTLGLGQGKSLCEIDYGAVSKKASSYITDFCKDLGDMHGGEGAGGFCGGCPGATDGRIDGYLCRICPGFMQDGLDDGCYCVNSFSGEGEEYTGGSDAYCCEGNIVEISEGDDPGGCTQITPASLKSVGDLIVEEQEGQGECQGFDGREGSCKTTEADATCGEGHEENAYAGCDSGICCVEVDGYNNVGDKCYQGGRCTLLEGTDTCGDDKVSVVDIDSCGPNLACCIDEEKAEQKCCVEYKSDDNVCIYFARGESSDCPADTRTEYVADEEYCNEENIACSEKRGCCVDVVTRKPRSYGADETPYVTLNSNSCTASEIFVPDCEDDDVSQVLNQNQRCCMADSIYYNTIDGKGIESMADCESTYLSNPQFIPMCNCNEVDCQDYGTEAIGTANTRKCCMAGTTCYDSFNGVEVENRYDCDFDVYNPNEDTWTQPEFVSSCEVAQHLCLDFTFEESDDFKKKEPICPGTLSWWLASPHLNGVYPLGWKTCQTDVGEPNVYTCNSEGRWSALRCNHDCVESGDGNAKCPSREDLDICVGNDRKWSEANFDPKIDGVFDKGDVVCGSSAHSSKKNKVYVCKGDGRWEREFCNALCSQACLNKALNNNCPEGTTCKIIKI